MLDWIKNWVRKDRKESDPSRSASSPNSAAATGPAPVVGVGPGDIPLGGVGAGLIAIYLLLVAGASFAFLLVRWPTLENGCRHDEAAATTPSTATAPAAAPGQTSQTTTSTATTPAATTGQTGQTTTSTSTTPATTIGQTTDPELDSLSPASGTITGDTGVRLRGKGLPEKPSVSFGGVSATVTSESATEISVRTPSHSLGPVNVVVSGGGKSTKLTAAYTYVCPDGYNAILFTAALLAGILGGSLHALRSLIWYRGNKTLVRSWTLRYFLLPFTGGIIAVAFYLLVQVGLFTPQNGNGNLLILGIAVLVGMFSEQSTEKLRKIAEALLTEAPKGANQTPPVQPAPTGASTTAPTSFSVKPEIGSIDGGKDLVVLSGPGLSTGTTVTLDGQPVNSRSMGSNALVFLPPAHAAGRVDLVVTNPGQAPVTLSKAYLYTPVSPTSGPKAGKTKVTIQGAGFTNTCTVTIGGSPAANVTLVNGNTLTADTPAAAKEGIAALKVTDQGNNLLDLPEAFRYE
jgi:hypothetical protein